MTSKTSHPGLILGIARFYYDPRGSARGMISSHPSEARLLAYALIAAGMLLAGRLLAVSTSPPAREEFMGRLSSEIVSMLFIVPLANYGLAALGTLVSRAFGGVGGWRDGRAAFFWAVLVSAPIIVLTVMFNAVATGLPEGVSIAVRQSGHFFFAWALSQCFSEIFGFSRAWLVFIVVCSPAVLLILATLATRF